MLKIYNTLTQQKEIFKPIVPGQVGLYVCGVTVYDLCHLGHARAYIAFDMVVRYLQFIGYQVQYIRNITDIDDKIIQRALDEKSSASEVSEFYTKKMHADFAALGLLAPTAEPRATDYIDLMIALIETLMQQGYAYVGDNQDVFYAVDKFSNYGRLAKRSVEQTQAGARVDVNTAKRHAADFVLWKQAKAGEPYWPSPWGDGRPGWHLECSAMAMKLLGEQFDLHGGGADLIFPHHENECAQSEAATGKQFVNTWMHVGFLQIDHEKMSKSLNNFFTIADVLATVHPEVLRFFMLAGHYRSPLDYTQQQIADSSRALTRLYTALRGLELPATELELTDNIVSEYINRFTAAMNDDFNTPEALAVLFDVAREINRCKEQQNLAPACKLARVLTKLGSILGVCQVPPEEFFQQQQADSMSITQEQIAALIQQRNQARQQKNWQEADRLRDELLANGIVIEDTADGTIWRTT